MTEVELRCPEGMRKLLGKAIHATAARPLPDGVLELTCSNCARARRAAGTPCLRVLHRFNLLGELIATEVVPAA